ncbi:DUF4135 domain-containing protein [Streptococcus pneumoniae]|uniref:DUF4135 domain-containing protein n=1 Tax=Streptococcus pneumoniae TaxID=1313 RepID=UPI00342EAC20
MIYLFNGSDIHFENLISYGDMPVIIDFETMLQQPLFDDKNWSEFAGYPVSQGDSNFASSNRGSKKGGWS